MSDALKVLGQADLAATTLTDLYTVTAPVTGTVVSSVVICNRNGFSITFRISVAVAGAADDVKQYLYYDETLAANDTFIATIGLTLSVTDKLRVRSSNTGVTASAFGAEVS